MQTAQIFMSMSRYSIIPRGHPLLMHPNIHNQFIHYNVCYVIIIQTRPPMFYI